jgi:arylsulfatase A-like enzyme
MTEPFEAIKPKYFNRLRWNYRTQHAVNDVANRVNKSGDRFVFTNIFSAHADYRPFPRHAPDVSEDAWELSKVTRNGDGNNIRARYNYADLRDEYSERVVKETRELYQSEVQWVDENLGDLWDELKRTGRLEDTVVIITSDHGELFGESEEVPLSHRNSLHPALIDVPLLIYHPHMQPDRESRLVSHVDIAPTILDITDIDAGYRMDGRSVFGEESHEVVFAEHGPQELVDKHEFLREKWNADLGPLELDRKVARSSSTTVRLRSDRSRVVHDRQQESNDTNDEEADELANLIHNELTWVEEMEKESIDEKNVQQQLDDLGYI